MSADPPLIEGYVDLEAQLQANGIDLTLASIDAIAGTGRIGVSNDQRRLPEPRPVEFGADGFARLAPGPYVITLNETVRLPKRVMALAKPRSSLLRGGVAVYNAVWDAGYHGRSQALLVVYNPEGFHVAKDARVIQMVFMTLETETDSPYAGRYQGENIGRPR